MPIGPSRLSLLTFPQFWDGNSLMVRFLCLPKGDPLAPIRPGLPTFAASNLVFEARLIGSPDRLPHAQDATPVGPLLLNEPPTQKSDLFTELTTLFKIEERRPLRPKPQFRKVITESYRTLIGDRRRSKLLSEPGEFACALHQGAMDQPEEPIAPSDKISWGRLMAFALRQPKLASGLGLIGEAIVTPLDPAFFSSGGWLYIDLHATSDYAAEIDFTALYAARIPKLTAARPVFAAVLFPVGPADFVADDLSREVQLYDDGIAKLVHCAQDNSVGDSIQLAWEDEQITDWLHRQVQVIGGELERDAPNGVAGYRVDVRKFGDDVWNSLMRIKSRGDLKLGAFSLGAFNGEGIVEVAPAQVSPKQDGQYWLPSYFANWRGRSLVLTDADLTNLHSRADVQAAENPQHLLNREAVFEAVDDQAVRLQYGEKYEFRVRLADLTRGGPEIGAPDPDPRRSAIAGITFQRRKAPGPIEILERPIAGSRRVRIARPRLGYPEALFTGAATFADLELDLDRIAADPKITREISVPDPDVLNVEIQVEVRALNGDASHYFLLYRTTRPMDAEELTIDLAFENHAALTTLAANQPADGPLTLPAARDLRLTFIGIGRDQAGYFADERVRRGAPVPIDVRAGATAEEVLLVDPDSAPSVRSFFFQPPPPGNTVPPPAERLAAEIGLDYAALTLSGRQGRRTVVACSAELHHTLSPELSAISFASNADLVQRWINVVQFRVPRDWTWDGLDGAGITVTRVVHFSVGPDIVETVGDIRLPKVVGKKSLVGVLPDSRDPARQFTDLIFFDAFDPKPRTPRTFPSEITIDYVLEPAFRDLPVGDAVGRTILLPLTTPPSQTPRIVSAGIALSDYKAAGDYSSTSQRRRMLWFEFADKPADPDDAYYVRVLAQGPDPMLLPDTTFIVPDATETPLPIDPEWMRLITPGQPRDESGLGAMQQLEASPQAGHYLVPLPPGLQESSAELFGFFVYEIRLGHNANRWSTAQGRFGPILRVAGVQHPAPPLVCQAARNKTAVLVQAAFSTPVLNGANLRPAVPLTELWAVLYARVRQADGAAWRNVMLTRSQLFPPVGNQLEPAGVPVLNGHAEFRVDNVTRRLRDLGLPADEPLTVLAAELFADPKEVDPLGARLGHTRIIRISPLVPVPDAC